jgi:Fe-S-cluster containining protein
VTLRLPVLPRGDSALLAAVDAACADAVRRAGARLACRIGCTECCVGPFPITALDAARLRAGLAALGERDAVRAAALRERARRAAKEMTEDAGAFPGDIASGVLADDVPADDGPALDGFLAAHAALPCPALDPETGACELYLHRPVSCRTFGPPMTIEGEDLPPCRLCFVNARPDEVDAARGRLECHALEEPLERELELAGAGGQTLVAFALARSPKDPSFESASPSAAARPPSETR